jgi:hypothetical protein
MSTGLRDLVARLRLDTTLFRNGLQGAARAAKQFAIVAAAASAVGTALSTAALIGAADIDKVAKAARRVGSSILGFRALEMAAGEAGVGVDTLADAVQTMDREIAKGSKGAIVALGQLGLSVSDLTGLEADQKLALIADRIQEFGLSSGEASAVLQGLGIKNKEMLLAVQSGGDVFRNARADVEDYGLALSSVESDKIEAANDAIGRLSLIGQYLSQQSALSIVPALGMMAQAMTDSLREGGLLRSMIDGLVGSLDVIAASAAVAVAAFGLRFVGAFLLAQVATFSLVGALAVLKVALIRTGIGAVVVAAGYLIAKFVELVESTGSFGGALGLLADVATEVWSKIGSGVSFITNSIAAMSASAQAYFLGALRRMAGAWVDFTWAIADGLNSLFGSSLMGADAGITVDLAVSQIAAEDAAAAYVNAASAAKNAFNAPLASLQALNTKMAETKEATKKVVESFEELGGSAGNAGGAIDALKDKTDAPKKEMEDFKSAAESAFVGFVTGAKTAREALSQLLASMAQTFAKAAFSGLWGALFPKFADGAAFSGGRVTAFASGGIVSGATAFRMQSGLGVMGEAGPEAIMPLTRGRNGKLGVQASGGGGSMHVTVTMDQSTGALGAFVRDQAGQVVAQAGPSIVSQSVQASRARDRKSKF